jgi:hypothetical protein
VFKTIWESLVNVKLTIYLLFLISLNLAVGALYIKYYPEIFRPLNQMLFQDWLKVYPTGMAWWIFSVISLLILFGLNTFVCTVDKLVALWPKRREYPFKRFFLSISPSLMHLFALVALIGHALIVFVGDNKEMYIKSGDTITTTEFTIEIKEIQPEYWTIPSLANQLRQCTVTLEIKTPSITEQKRLRFLRPLWIRGWSVHLDIDPKSKDKLPLKIILKNEPGSRLILLGGGLLSLLLLWYYVNINHNKKESNIFN